MHSLLLHEFKRQASFFLNEKFKTARLALTDVTPTQLLTEEATTGDLIAPNMQTMRLISRAAFEVDDYYRIVDVLHKRLSKFDRRNWRPSYKALILLEYLLTHGPESIAEEFQSDEDVIIQMGSFEYVDEKGFNWGSSVRNMSDRVIKLLKDRSLLKEERHKARKVTVGIKGFGSFCNRPISGEESMKEAISERHLRSNSHFTDCQNKENQIMTSDNGFSCKQRFNWGPSIRNMSERVIKPLEDGSFLKEERERATFEIRGFGSFCERPVSGEESMKEAFSERYLRSNSHFTDCKQKLESTHIGVIHKNDSYKKMEIDIDDPNSSDAMEWDQHPFGDITDNHNGASLLSISGLSSKGLRYRGGRKKNVVE